MPAKRKQSSLKKTKNTTTYGHGGPMQYFREGYETKKKMMLGGMVLDEPEFDFGDPVAKAQRKRRKASRKMQRQANKFKKSKPKSGCQAKVMTGGKCRKRR